jgi:hypothetical protein
MTCREIEDRVALYAGGDLDAEAARHVERHVQTCPACRDLLATVRDQREMMAEWRDAEPSEDALRSVRDGVLAGIGRGDARPGVLHRIGFGPSRPVVWGSAGLAAAALLVFAVWTMSHPQDVEPSPSAAAAQSHTASQAAAVVPAPEAALAPAQPERLASARRETPAPETRPVPGAGPRAAAPPPSPAGTRAMAGPPRGGGPTEGPVRRIEFQTADPNIRIIWLMPGASPDPDRSGAAGR